MYDTTALPLDQVVDRLLIDIHPTTGKLVSWSDKKSETEKMAIACDRIGKNIPVFANRAFKIHDCASYLEFLESSKTGEKRLDRVFFCRYRLCPMCSWRRSLKIFGQTTQVMNITSAEGYRYLFATMSIQNCTGELLKNQIDQLFSGYTNLTRRVDFKNCVYGTMRTLEVTHNVKPDDIWFDTYNAHIHAIFVVHPSYFKKKYISQDKWLEWWRRSVKVDYKPHFHIKAVKNKKGDNNKAIREVSKYATKSGQILTNNPKLTDSAIHYLDQALERRRLVSYTGILKRIKKELNLDDPETGDLIDVDNLGPVNESLEWIRRRYRFDFGYSQYIS